MMPRPPPFDPEIQPVVPSQALAPLEARALTLDFIRRAFTHPPAWQVEPVFADWFNPAHARLPGTARAAVLMPVVQRDNGLHLLLTRRTEHLAHHAGQISFPGGRIEAEDASAVAAALRETQEETGIAPEFAQVLGTQPSMLTTTRFIVTPVVGTLKPGFQVHANPFEVAEVFEVPLAVFSNPACYRLHRIDLPGEPPRLYFSLTWDTHFIWGVTAALMRNFHRFLLAAQDSARPSLIRHQHFHLRPHGAGGGGLPG